MPEFSTSLSLVADALRAEKWLTSIDENEDERHDNDRNTPGRDDHDGASQHRTHFGRLTGRDMDTKTPLREIAQARRWGTLIDIWPLGLREESHRSPVAVIQQQEDVPATPISRGGGQRTDGGVARRGRATGDSADMDLRRGFDFPNLHDQLSRGATNAARKCWPQYRLARL